MQQLRWGREARGAVREGGGERGEGGEQRDCGEGVRRWGAGVGRQREQAKRAGCEAAHRAGGVAKGSC